MHLTLGEAARQSGVSKTKVSRAIRDGKLTAARSGDTGSYRIEQSELQRYLDATEVVRASVEPVAVGESATALQQAALEAQIEGLRRVADLLQRQLDDALTQRDKWEQAFQQQARQLGPPQSATLPPAPAQANDADAAPPLAALPALVAGRLGGIFAIRTDLHKA